MSPRASHDSPSGALALRARPFVLGACALALAACASPDSERATAPLSDAVVVQVLASPPPGGDGPSTLSVTWRGVPVDFQPPAIAAVRWSDALVVTDRARVTWRVDADGRRGRLADHVAVPPVASDDGRALAIVLDGERPDGVTLAIAEDGVVRTVARELASCAPLRFSPSRDTLAFVSPSPGGVAGLHVIALRRAAIPVCVTNCGLRTGVPWGDRFVPTPLASSLRFVDGGLTWNGAPR